MLMLTSRRDVRVPGSPSLIVFWEERAPDSEEEMIIDPARYGSDSLEMQDVQSGISDFAIGSSRWS
jgi:hypothetical protein